MDNFLCFGLANASAIFQRISTSIARMMRKRGFKIISYPNRRALPACVHTVALFIAHLAEIPLEYTTIPNYTFGVNSFHRSNNHHAPELTNYKIEEALAGLRRSRLEALNRRREITPSILMKIYRILPYINSTYRDTSWAAWLVAFVLNAT